MSFAGNGEEGDGLTVRRNSVLAFDLGVNQDEIELGQKVLPHYALLANVSDVREFAGPLQGLEPFRAWRGLLGSDRFETLHLGPRVALLLGLALLRQVSEPNGQIPKTVAAHGLVPSLDALGHRENVGLPAHCLELLRKLGSIDPISPLSFCLRTHTAETRVPALQCLCQFSFPPFDTQVAGNRSVKNFFQRAQFIWIRP